MRKAVSWHDNNKPQTINHQLDNPVWAALSSKQVHFNRGNDLLKYFPSDVAPFMALENWNEKDLEILEQQLPAARTFSFVSTKNISLPDSLETVISIPLYQMHCPVLQPVSVPENLIMPLGDEHIPLMLELTAMTKPGPFYQRTIDFGNYLGIFQDDQLVSMAGDRMKVNGYTEVSAICTHPDHTGKKYASYLTTRAAERIIQEGDIPFLHVRTDNLRAIEVYKKMGFEVRADINFAIFKKRE
ncbi:MAG: GNAT family N-acetyltransferase [Chitinophagaceae bacterium]